MNAHAHTHPHTRPHPRAEAHLAQILDLDAAASGPYLDLAAEWAASLTSGPVTSVVDLGAGTGVGSFALARRFEDATVFAIDRSPVLLDHLRTAAHTLGLADRIQAVQTDVDDTWRQVGTPDLVWAASLLHEVADPDAVLRDIHAALRPGGLLVVIEMDALPRFLAGDVDAMWSALEARCHEVLHAAGWNVHPDWRPAMEEAGFQNVWQRTFPTDAASSDSPAVSQYARAFLSRIRMGVEGRLPAQDLRALDALLADHGPDSVLTRGVSLRGSRTAWAGRRSTEAPVHAQAGTPRHEEGTPQ